MAILKAQPEGLSPGVYFDLDEKLYHDDPALSHSGMVDLLSHPLDYWMGSPLNPHRKEFKETDAMKFGKRCHKLLLEGERFFDTYAVYGMRPSSALKHIFLSKDAYDAIRDSVKRIRMVPLGDEHFKHGYPEVSIFWRDTRTGIMLRIRVDYLRTFGGIDYKRIRDIGNSTIGNAIVDQGMDIQCALYMEGIQELRRMLLADQAVIDFGRFEEDADYSQKAIDWLARFIKTEETMFRFVFQRSAPPFVWRMLDLDDELLAVARNDVDVAKDIYVSNITKYGVAEWPASSGQAEEFSIFNVPRRIHDRQHS